MAGKTDKTKPVQVRIPNKEFYAIEEYARKNGMNRSQAIVSLLRKALDDTSEPATKADLVALAATLEKAIQNQPIAVQEAKEPEALPVPEEPRAEYRKTWFGLYRRIGD